MRSAVTAAFFENSLGQRSPVQRDWGEFLPAWRAAPALRVLLVGFSFTLAMAQSPPAAAKPEDCWHKRDRSSRAEAVSCFTRLTRTTDPYLRAEGFYGLQRFKDANDNFRAAVALKKYEKDPAVRARWGRMLSEPFNENAADAAELFEEALEIDKNYAPAMLGLATIAARGFETKAVELCNKALAADPKLTEAREFLAHLAIEDSDFKKAVEEAEAALKQNPEALDAMAAYAAIETIEDRDAKPWLDRIYKISPLYGNAHFLIGHHLVLNRRYEEAIAQFRKALELDPDHLEAQSKLGITLMQVGRDQEAKKLLSEAFDRGFRNAATTNSLNLIDSYKHFVTIKSGNVVLKLHKKESELLSLYVEDELKRAIATFEKKYKLNLPRPVQLEVYPNHDDFAVRTMGLPGLGALGVTFGDVVAMDSPSGRPPGTFHWATTLWHELSHVFVLTATRHRVPRWFTEGMAVHEETATHKDWGDRLGPEVITAVKEKKLLPIAGLDRGFVRPAYRSQVIVSYFQAGKICDYISERWGYQKLLDMMHAYAARTTTPEVIEKHLGLKPEEFDRQFLAWLDKSVGPTVAKFDEWRKRHGEARKLLKDGKHDEAIALGRQLRDWYPDYVEAHSAYQLLADAHLAKKETAAALAELEKYSDQGGRDPALLHKLAGMQQEAGKPRAAIRTLERLNWIYPVGDEELHRKLGSLLIDDKNAGGAIREFRAVLAMKPNDRSSALYNLARAYLSAGNEGKAEEHVLEALEIAPGYRPAQKLLVQLNASKKEKP